MPVLLLAQMVVVLVTSPETRANVAHLIGRTPSLPTYGAYYAPDLFDRVAERIGTDRSTYRIVSLGLPPAVAQYNGFFTLDSYQYDYPLDYKHRFRRIIARELAKNDAIRAYFDHWGNRCYAFAAELGRDWMVGRDSGRVVGDLAWDIDALVQMGGRFVLSAVPIDNGEVIGLALRGEFLDEGAFWHLWLYEAAAKRDRATP